MYGTLKLLLCVALVLVTLSAHAQLTLEEAQRRALERSRQLAAQDSAVRSSREMAVAAGQLPDPVLKLGIDNLPINGPDQFSLTRDFMTMRRIGVMQELTRGEKRDLRAQRFDREAEKAVAEKTAAVASIQRDTALAWLDRYYAEAMLAVIARQIEQVKTEITAAEGLYRGADHRRRRTRTRGGRVRPWREGKCPWRAGESRRGEPHDRGGHVRHHALQAGHDRREAG